MALPDAFYRPEGADFAATALTRGPWGDVQHGGPPAALLAGEIATFGDDAHERVLVRVGVELLRPIPIAPVRVEVTALRRGQRVDWLRATMKCQGKTVATATGVRIAVRPLDVPAPHCPPVPRLPPPSTTSSFTFPFFPEPVGYHRAVEVRIVEGTWDGSGPVGAWARPVVPLVAGRQTRPIEAVMIVADAQNGLCPALPIEDYVFINPDLDVRLRRPFEGPWVGMRSRSVAEPSGLGMTMGALFDAHGEVGSVAQSLTVMAR
ncbi:MAG: thioesterase family protein [Myxococcota bacterium]